MRTLIESFKRLYDKSRLTKEQISERLEKGTISADEYEYITGEAVNDGESA